jgi:hypothetical protein
MDKITALAKQRLKDGEVCLICICACTTGVQSGGGAQDRSYPAVHFLAVTQMVESLRDGHKKVAQEWLDILEREFPL